MPLAIGLMSGTSLDGIDAALVETDGEAEARPLAFVSLSYEPAFRSRLRDLLGGEAPAERVAPVERELTERHAEAVATLLAAAGIGARQVETLGFHGQTLFHAPHQRTTWQIGDGALLARLTGIATVSDFRSADVAAGGQGAPLVPLYHLGLVRAAGLAAPLAVLNLGGVGNLTWIAADEAPPLAFDTGPGNALLDDWCLAQAGLDCDRDGALAFAGTVEEALLERLLAHPYFAAPPPKSLDRDAFETDALDGLAPADGAATLTEFTAASVARAVPHLPAPPQRWLVAGGGRRNPAMMMALRARLGVPVDPVEAVGWNGDALEAEAFAFLAVRSRRGLPLSLPSTTGVPTPMTGGRLNFPGNPE
jgi:anhydro-N-acetylmuramic acid kinase